MKYGGEIRTELTSEVTHLIAVALCGSKVRQIMKKGLNDRSQYLVSPLWLEKSVAGGAREVETEHDPRRWLCGTDSAAVPAMQAFSSQFLAGMQFVIGKLRPESLDDPELRAAVVAQIEECGGEVLDEPRGVCVRIDNFCAELRGARAVRSRHWLDECHRWRTCEWPAEALDWRGWLFAPFPEKAISGAEDKQVTLTGYNGIQRDVIKQLIRLTGAHQTNTMSRENTHLISARPGTQKHTAAQNWGIRAVNHLWLTDSVVMWKWQPIQHYQTSGEDEMSCRKWSQLDPRVRREQAMVTHPHDVDDLPLPGEGEGAAPGGAAGDEDATQGEDTIAESAPVSQALGDETEIAPETRSATPAQPQGGPAPSAAKRSSGVRRAIDMSHVEMTPRISAGLPPRELEDRVAGATAPGDDGEAAAEAAEGGVGSPVDGAAAVEAAEGGVGSPGADEAERGQPAGGAEAAAGAEIGAPAGDSQESREGAGEGGSSRAGSPELGTYAYDGQSLESIAPYDEGCVLGERSQSLAQVLVTRRPEPEHSPPAQGKGRGKASARKASARKGAKKSAVAEAPPPGRAEVASSERAVEQGAGAGDGRAEGAEAEGRASAPAELAGFVSAEAGGSPSALWAPSPAPPARQGAQVRQGRGGTASPADVGGGAQDSAGEEEDEAPLARAARGRRAASPPRGCAFNLKSGQKSPALKTPAAGAARATPGGSSAAPGGSRRGGRRAAKSPAEDKGAEATVVAKAGRKRVRRGVEEGGAPRPDGVAGAPQGGAAGSVRKAARGGGGSPGAAVPSLPARQSAPGAAVVAARPGFGAPLAGAARSRALDSARNVRAGAGSVQQRGGTSRAAKCGGRYVLVAGRSSERQQQMATVSRLGGRSAHLHCYDPGVTHIVIREFRRTEKMLCACAAGKWVVKPSYLESCGNFGEWVPEHAHEWHNPRKCEPDNGIWHGAPRRWRTFWEKHQRGPFAGQRYLICLDEGTDASPPAQVIAQVICAGGGEAELMQSAPATPANVAARARSSRATFVIAGDGSPAVGPNLLAELRKGGAELVTATFVMDLVMKQPAAGAEHSAGPADYRPSPAAVGAFLVAGKKRKAPAGKAAVAAGRGGKALRA